MKDIINIQDSFKISDEESYTNWDNIKKNISQKKEGFKGLIFKFLFWISGGNGKLQKVDAEIRARKENFDAFNHEDFIKVQSEKEAIRQANENAKSYLESRRENDPIIEKCVENLTKLSDDVKKNLNNLDFIIKQLNNSDPNYRTIISFINNCIKNASVNDDVKEVLQKLKSSVDSIQVNKPLIWLDENPRVVNMLYHRGGQVYLIASYNQTVASKKMTVKFKAAFINTRYFSHEELNKYLKLPEYETTAICNSKGNFKDYTVDTMVDVYETIFTHCIKYENCYDEIINCKPRFIANDCKISIHPRPDGKEYKDNYKLYLTTTEDVEQLVNLPKDLNKHRHKLMKSKEGALKTLKYAAANEYMLYVEDGKFFVAMVGKDFKIITSEIETERTIRTVLNSLEKI